MPCYTFCKSQVFPDEEMPDFRTYTWKLYKEALRVGFKVLEVMGVALQLKVVPNLQQLAIV